MKSRKASKREMLKMRANPILSEAGKLKAKQLRKDDIHLSQRALLELGTECKVQELTEYPVD